MFLFAVASVPFNGILVRYRTSYHPKVSVDEGVVPEPPTFFSLAKRVWRREGLKGLMKGLVPTAFFMTLYGLFSPFVTRIYLSPSASTTRNPEIGSGVIYAAFYVLAIVTTYRAIVTPSNLDPLNGREALHILFSAHERKKPWSIYQIPGLFSALVLNLIFNSFIVHEAKRIIFPWHFLDMSVFETWVRYAGLVVVSLIATIVSAPLEVIVTRLALQRNYGGLTFAGTQTTIVGAQPMPEEVSPAAPGQVGSTPGQAGSTPEADTIVSATTELISEKVAYPVEKPVVVQPVENISTNTNVEVDLEQGTPTVESNDVVIYLRDENDPYLGLIDCGKKIIAEEGWPVLYRMWFVTFLGIYFSPM